MQPEVASICAKAARWFASLGAEVMDDSPDVHDAQHIFQVGMLLLRSLPLDCSNATAGVAAATPGLRSCLLLVKCRVKGPRIPGNFTC